ncbi:MAG: TlpA family protein disulfide reductase [Lachnospiraceae bacterium]|nr:TlpA family protein disulfide reductase [Lachnospiraceae bacterium]
MCKMNKKYLSVFIILTVLLSGCTKENADISAGGASASEAAESAPAPEPEQSDLTIDFEGTDIEGNVVTSDIFSQSKLTMVNVWATYCNPCLSEMPGLGELADEYDAEEFQIIGIISDVVEGEEQELAEDLIKRTQADYTHLLLNESIYYALLTDVAAVPTTFFIDENGVVLDTVVGAMEKSAWEEKINALLEEQ